MSFTNEHSFGRTFLAQTLHMLLACLLFQRFYDAKFSVVLALEKPGGTCLCSGTSERYTRCRQLPFILLIRTALRYQLNHLKPTGYVMNQQV
jgi:hypothetical protein